MNYCPECGVSIAKNSRFCAECGHKIDHDCKSCGHPASSDAKFCEVCASPFDQGRLADSVSKVFGNLPAGFGCVDCTIGEISEPEMAEDGTATLEVSYQVSNPFSYSLGWVDTTGVLIDRRGRVVSLSRFSEQVDIDEADVWNGELQFSGVHKFCLSAKDGYQVLLKIQVSTEEPICAGEWVATGKAYQLHKIQARRVHGPVHILEASSWNTKPDDDNDQNLELSVFLQNLSATEIPAILFKGSIQGSGGDEDSSDTFENSEPLYPHELGCLAISEYVTSSALTGGTVSYSVASFIPVGYGVAVSKTYQVRQP